MNYLTEEQINEIINSGCNVDLSISYLEIGVNVCVDNSDILIGEANDITNTF